MRAKAKTKTNAQGLPYFIVLNPARPSRKRPTLSTSTISRSSTRAFKRQLDVCPSQYQAGAK
jgi:hypothetical protein